MPGDVFLPVNSHRIDDKGVLKIIVRVNNGIRWPVEVRQCQGAFVSSGEIRWREVFIGRFTRISKMRSEH